MGVIIVENYFQLNNNTMRLFSIISLLLLNQAFALAQNAEYNSIKTTLSNYIQGTSFNNTQQIEQAFYPEANLYLEGKQAALRIVPITEYLSWFKNATTGQSNGRIGHILSIEYFNSIAIAKVEILIPKRDMRFVDMFLLKKLNGHWQIISKSAASSNSNRNGLRILFVVSNAKFYGKSQLATGNSFSEIVNAYDTFTKAGYTVDFVSPEGGSIPLAYINTSEKLHMQYLYNPDFMYALKNTNKPQDIDPAQYKAVYYVGGGSAMFGVPENQAIQNIAMRIYEDHDGIVSSVCHGTAGIVFLKMKNGKYLVDGKTVNGYPEAYERAGADYFQEFPFLIQKTIEAHGGFFKYSDRNTVHVESDGKLVTGQNHLSSKQVALKVIEQIEKE